MYKQLRLYSNFTQYQLQKLIDVVKIEITDDTLMCIHTQVPGTNLTLTLELQVNKSIICIGLYNFDTNEFVNVTLDDNQFNIALSDLMTNYQFALTRKQPMSHKKLVKIWVEQNKVKPLRVIDLTQ